MTEIAAKEIAHYEESLKDQLKDMKEMARNRIEMMINRLSEDLRDDRDIDDVIAVVKAQLNDLSRVSELMSRTHGELDGLRNVQCIMKL